MTKSCPECGAIVPRDSAFCSTCGARLSVMPDTESFTLSGRDDDIDIEKLNDQLLTPQSIEEDYTQEQPLEEERALNIDMNDGDEMASTQGYRVSVKRNNDDDEMPRRSTKRASSANEAASSYKEFSRYADKGKKRKRSMGRKVLSMMLLVAAVGGALYFLLGLRKLPPGDLPPIAKNDVIPEPTPLPVINVTEPDVQSVVAEPSGIAVAENVLPNFTPDREPRSGVITGSAVNVREDHTTSSSRVTRLKSGTRVEVIGTYNVTSGQYAGIWYNTGSMFSHWVLDFLRDIRRHC